MKFRSWMGNLFIVPLVLLLAAAKCGGGGSVVVPGQTSIPSVLAVITPAASCSPGSPTVQANGVDVCQVTIQLSLDPVAADFPDVAVTVSGASGYFFYSDPNTVNEPITSGQATRTYSVSFNPTTGVAAPLIVYIRSTTAGQQTLNFSSLGMTSSVEFDALVTPPTITPSVTLGAECDPAGTPTAQADQIDTCAVTLDLAASPATPNFTMAVEVSGPAGYLFYNSLAEALSGGRSPRLFSADFGAGGTNASITFYVRTDTMGQGVISLLSTGLLDTSATVEFTSPPAPPGAVSVGSVVVPVACQPGTASVLADGSDICTVTLNLNMTVGSGSGYQQVVNVSGPVDFLLYGASDPMVEPLSAGQTPRSYLADFGTGTTAQVMIHVRSSVAQSGMLTITSGLTVNTSADVEFAAAGGSTYTPTVTVDPNCTPGVPVATANGLDVCQLTLDLTLSPAATQTTAVTVSAPAGYLFYDSAGAAVDTGTNPRVYSVSITSGTGSANIFVRSTLGAERSVSFNIGGITTTSANMEFQGNVFYTPPVLTVGNECLPTMSTVQANGIDYCKLTFSVSLSVPDPNFFDVAVSVSGPGGVLFYNSAGEPLANGQSPRIYSVTFDPVTGQAVLDIYVRSTQPGTGSIHVQSGGAVDITEDVEFLVDTTVPTQVVIFASSFVGSGGSTSVVATVYNGNGDPIPSTDQQFTIFFSSDDPFGRFNPPSPVLRTISALTNVSGQATVNFDTTDTTAHAVTLTATITNPVVSVPAAQATVQVFDALSGPAKANYQLTSYTEGRVGNGALRPADVSGFFGTPGTNADVLTLHFDILSVDMVNEGMTTCDCDAATDGMGCSGVGAGQVACPAAGNIQINCPSGLGNPTQTACQFATTGNTTFMTEAQNSSCVGVASGSCFKFTCPGGASTCGSDLIWRVNTSSVAKQTSRVDHLHPIIPTVLVGGTALTAGNVDRTDVGGGLPAALPESVVLMADPTLPAEAVFTAPFMGDASNQNCTVMTADPTASMTVIQCSSKESDYAAPLSDVLQPKVPVLFNVSNVLGTIFDPMTSGSLPVSLSFNGPPPPASAYNVCYSDGISGCMASDVSGDIAFGTTLGVSSGAYIFPPFTVSSPYGGGSGVVATVGSTQSGFGGKTKSLLFNPQCTSPVAVQCQLASQPMGPTPPMAQTCFGALPATANGSSCDYAECTIRSFGQMNPGMLGCTGAEVVADGNYALRLTDDGDAEVEDFCDANGTCTSGAFSTNLALPFVNQKVQAMVRVDSTQTASATFSVDFLARVVRTGGVALAPADLIQQIPSFTMARDPALPATVQIEFLDLAGSTVTDAYTQYAAASATAPDVFAFYNMTTDSKFQGPFARRVRATIKNYGGGDYTASGAGDLLCTVTLSASGGATGTLFPAWIDPACVGPGSATPMLGQTMGSAVVEACVISNGVTNAASSTATVTGTLSNCSTGSGNANLTINSAVRSVRYRYNVNNTTGATVSFSGLQADTTLNGTAFCKPSNPDCSTAQPEAFRTVDLLAGKGALGVLTMDQTELRALYSDTPPPGTCNNVFSLGASQMRGVWEFDVRLAPDPDGDMNAGAAGLLARLQYDEIDADGVFSNAQIASEQITQYSGTYPLCSPAVISTVQFDILPGSPIYYGAP